MKKIGVQLFGLKKEMGEDVYQTLRKIKDIGFNAVETAIIFNDRSGKLKKRAEEIAEIFGQPLPKSVWRQADATKYMDYAVSIGLQITSCHVFFADAYDGITEEIKPALLDFANKYGIKEYVFSYMASTRVQCDAQKNNLNTAIVYLEENSVHLAYHNHELELQNYVGENTVLDYLISIADERLKIQFDIGWGHFANYKVEDFIEKYHERISSLHLKDLIPGANNGNRQEVFVAVGTGNVPIEYALEHADECPLIESGIIIDQDDSLGNMLEDIEIGFNYARAILDR